MFGIAKYLRKRYHIPFNRIKIEHSIRITGKKVKVLGPVGYGRISRIRGLVHTPDVMVVDEEGAPMLIIEQDGKSHDSEERALKDEGRNAHYRGAGIPFIIMKTSVIIYLGVTPAAYLDSEMKRRGWHPRREPGADAPP